MGNVVFKEESMNALQDNRLSFACKGVYTHMVEYGKEFYFVSDFLSEKDGVTAINNAISKLIALNYVKLAKPNLEVYCLCNSSKLEPNCDYGIVYIISDPYQNYKIGITTNLSKRLCTYKTCMPYEPKIIKVCLCKNYKVLEKDIHRQFRTKHINGEWFNLDAPDLSQLTNMLEINKAGDV